MDKKERAQAEALVEYTDAYLGYASVSITQEEAAIRFNKAMREALDLGIPLQVLRQARHAVDNHAEFMTDWK